MRPLTVFLLWSSVASAADEKVQAIIWAGGATQEAGQAALEQWKGRKKDIEDLVKLDTAFPRLEKSDDVAGMKPGFWVVVLGYCTAAESKTALEFLKGFEPNIYGRDVAMSAQACPLPNPVWKLSAVAEAKLGGGKVLAGGLYEAPDGSRSARVLLSLRGKDKQVLQSGSFEPGMCTLGALQAKGAQLVMGADCITPRCTTPDTFVGEVRYGLKKDKLVDDWVGKSTQGQCD